MRPVHLLLLATLALTACAGGESQGPSGWQMVSAALKQLRESRKGPLAPARLTRKQVTDTPVPLLITRVEADGRSGVFGRISTNKGVQTFASLDAISLSLRDGVLIGTRGLPPDLMSAEAPAAATIASGDASYQRRYQVLDGADTTLDLRYECHLRGEGRETLVIAERSYPTRKITEVCLGDGHVFENLFWIDGSGKIRQSRQWTGTMVGNLRMSDPS